MLTLFSYVGKIEDLRLYPTLRDVSMNVNARCCFVKFSDSVRNSFGLFQLGYFNYFNDMIFFYLVVCPCGPAFDKHCVHRPRHNSYTCQRGDPE